jgi:hypothetical protein
MAVTKLSNSGIKTGVLKYDSMLAGNAAYDPAAFVSIATVAVTSNTATITFSSIPQTYTHLQIRGIARTNRASAIDSYQINLNGNTNTIAHELRGLGSNPVLASSGNVANGIVPGANATANVFGAFITDILDYSNANKNKTVRSLVGFDNNGSSGEIDLTSSFRDSTAAITSITINLGTSNSYVANSHFALYGIRSA